MLEIYHHPLCPFSRKLRVVLNEKKIDFELVIEKYWERRPDFLTLNPAGDTPVVIKSEDIILTSNNSIFEYFEEIGADKGLLGESPLERARIRRFCDWFDNKFYQEVTKYLLSEKFIKVVTKLGETNSGAIRAAKKNVAYHLDYLNHILGEHDYLGGDRITLADISAAAQLSVLDFIGDVPWERSIKVKHWYSLMKSRPSFRPLLLDKVHGVYPPHHYSDPDF